MAFLLFVLILFIVLVGGGWFIGSSVGSALDKVFGNNREDKPTYIDNSVHHHYHTHEHGQKNVQNHNHLHQNLTIIDEETHKKGLGYFSEKQETRDGKTS